MRGLFRGRQKSSFTCNPATRFLIGGIRAYKNVLSPLLRPMCRFTPTCSEYAEESILRYGVPKGAWLSILRVLRCNRLFPGGWDPVP